jgi:uncharacterized repeat protein (TIGR03833 family)
MDGKKRSDVAPGARVQVVQKQDQRSGKLTEGTVQDVLTRSATHPHGIKVRLVGGVIGRVKMIIGQGDSAGHPRNSETDPRKAP